LPEVIIDTYHILGFVHLLSAGASGVPETQHWTNQEARIKPPPFKKGEKV